jgi:glycerol-3-phosphate dehydrogenase (NAD(P)+)
MALRITTIGDGAMATVCSQILADRADVELTMWVRDPAHLADMKAKRENGRYLPGVKLADRMKVEGDGAKALVGAELIVCAVPSQYLRGTLTRLKDFVPAGAPAVSVVKGIEVETLRRPSEIILEILGERPVAALSGPSIAGELARHLPCTMVAAAEAGEKPEASSQKPECGEDLSRRVQELFTTPYLRVYRNNDLLGVELAGALKNVIAIAAGILDGMKAGNNAKAALLTRGLVEISRLGVAMGAQPETFAGLAGLGDLVTTCVSPEGRNRTFGERVGRGEKPADVVASMVGVVEGLTTCRSVVTLARSMGVEMPISEGLYAVLYEGRDLRSQLADLMARELKHESASPPG